MFASVQRLRDRLAEVVDELEPGVFDAAGAVQMLDELAAIERLAGAAKLLMAGRVAETNAWKREGDRSPAHWVARRTGTTVGQAIGMLQTAERLRELPATAQALREGELSSAQVVEVAAAATADPSLEDDLLDVAATDGIAGLRQTCQRVKAAADADEVARHEAVRRRRSFRHWTDDDGAFRAAISGTPDDGARLLARLEPHVEAVFAEACAQGRRESHDAYAFDALMRLAESSGDDKRSGPKAVVHVNVDHSAFVRSHTVGGETCEIPGVGPIPVATARSLSSDAILVGIVMKGQDVTRIAHLGRTIPASLRRALEARDPECVVPGCHVREHLEIDHEIPVAEGGETSLANCRRKCAWHHYLKTHHGYRLEGPVDDGRWVTPDGGVDHDRSPPLTAA